MTTIKIPTPLRAYTGGNAEITVQGATVGAALDDLLRQHPDLKAQIYEGDRLRNFVNVFIGDEDVRYRDGMDTDISASDNLRIIPSIAGGAEHIADRQPMERIAPEFLHRRSAILDTESEIMLRHRNAGMRSPVDRIQDKLTGSERRRGHSVDDLIVFGIECLSS